MSSSKYFLDFVMMLGTEMRGNGAEVGVTMQRKSVDQIKKERV